MAVEATTKDYVEYFTKLQDDCMNAGLGEVSLLPNSGFIRGLLARIKDGDDGMISTEVKNWFKERMAFFPKGAKYSCLPLAGYFLALGYIKIERDYTAGYVYLMAQVETYNRARLVNLSGRTHPIAFGMHYVYCLSAELILTQHALIKDDTLSKFDMGEKLQVVAKFLRRARRLLAEERITLVALRANIDKKTRDQLCQQRLMKDLVYLTHLADRTMEMAKNLPKKNGEAAIYQLLVAQFETELAPAVGCCNVSRLFTSSRAFKSIGSVRFQELLELDPFLRRAEDRTGLFSENCRQHFALSSRSSWGGLFCCCAPGKAAAMADATTQDEDERAISFAGTRLV